MEEASISDNDAVKAGQFYTKYRKFGLSIVDTYVLTVAERERARLVTTDKGLRDAARDADVDMDYLPP